MMPQQVNHQLDVHLMNQMNHPQLLPTMTETAPYIVIDSKKLMKPDFLAIQKLPIQLKIQRQLLRT